MSKLHVISTGRNPNNAVRNCIESIARQTVLPDSHTVIDDMSSDETPEILKEIDKKGPAYLKIINNTERKYRLKNIYDHVITKSPEDIICIVDSDDWLAKKNVLFTIKEAYKRDSKLEYIYTHFRCAHETEDNYGESDGPSCPAHMRRIPSKDWYPYRDPWITSHMCTFKVKAVMSIPVENFLDWDGKWFRMATDHALAMPMLHILRERDGDYSAVKYIEKPLYVHHWAEDPNTPRVGEQDESHIAAFAGQCADFIRQRGYIKGSD